jgi:hypothetical protein
MNGRVCACRTFLLLLSAQLTSTAVCWVLPAIDVSYESQTHVLMRYQGLSDLRDSVGDNFQTTITFHPGDRKTVEESQWASARQAPLGPCR